MGEQKLRVKDFVGSEFFEWPEGWSAKRQLSLWIVTICAAVATPALCLALLGALVERDHHAALVFGEWTAGTALSALFFGSMLGGRRSRFSPPRQFHDPEHGGGIRTGLPIWPGILAVPLMALLAVGMYQGRVALASGDRKSLPVPVSCGLAVLFAFAAVYTLVLLLPSIHRQQGVALFPRGVSLCRGLFVNHIPWEALSEAAATEFSNGRGHKSNQLVFWLLPGTRISATLLVPGLRKVRSIEKRQHRFFVSLIETDPALLFHLCNFYLHHPELRHELGTGAAISRVLGRQPQPYARLS